MSSPAPIVVDGNGKQIALGSVLGRGGEGTVYDLKHPPGVVAKIYHKPLTPDRADKISAMISLRNDTLIKLTSWPMDLVRVKNSGQAIGLLMPKIANRKNIHHLYGPKSRLQDFPRADWRFLVRAAANIARAFNVVHHANCVIGDVNHGSIMVADDATVSLIDCDSFQVNTAAKRFLCEVGIETFTPPELQGLPFKGVVRTANFDNFGLAVMAFHLLFMGRHPFAGRFTGVGDMPIARAIKEFRFPYGANHKAMQIEPPPGTPPLSYVGPELADLFEKAFSQAAIKVGRPAADVWVSALQKLEQSARQCSTSKGHWFPGHLSACPWCRMEAQGANALFPFITTSTVAAAVVGSLNVEALWTEIEQLEILGPPQFTSSPVLSLKPSAAAIEAARAKPNAKGWAWAVGVVVFLIGTILMPPLFWLAAIAGGFAGSIVSDNLTKKSKVAEFFQAYTEAQDRLNRTKHAWATRAAATDFENAKREFLQAKADLSAVPAKRSSALQSLHNDIRRLQLENYLDRFRIANAKIDSIGPGRKTTLASYGIETAQDVTKARLSAVPGFGPKMIDKLTSWRVGLEKTFVFDASKAVDPREVAKVEQQMLALRSNAEKIVREKHGEAMLAHAKIRAARDQMRRELDQLQTNLATCES